MSTYTVIGGCATVPTSVSWTLDTLGGQLACSQEGSQGYAAATYPAKTGSAVWTGQIVAPGYGVPNRTINIIGTYQASTRTNGSLNDSLLVAAGHVAAAPAFWGILSLGITIGVIVRLVGSLMRYVEGMFDESHGRE